MCYSLSNRLTLWPVYAIRHPCSRQGKSHKDTLLRRSDPVAFKVKAEAERTAREAEKEARRAQRRALREAEKEAEKEAAQAARPERRRPGGPVQNLPSAGGEPTAGPRKKRKRAGLDEKIPTGLSDHKPSAMGKAQGRGLHASPEERGDAELGDAAFEAEAEGPRDEIDNIFDSLFGD